MNPDRSTEKNSALRWLNLVQRGGTNDWKRLYRECRDLTVARAVAEQLTWRDPDFLPSVRLWKFLLEDLHPQIEVDLHEADRAIGV